MMRVMGIVTAAVVASHLAGTSALAVPATESRHEQPSRTMPVGNSVEPTGTKVSFHAGRAHHVRHKFVRAATTEYAAEWRADMAAERPVVETNAPAANPALADPVANPALPTLPPNMLTTQENDVGKVAVRNGDEKFLMVDKSLGRILLWEAGKPVFVGNALTGASYSDRLPTNEMKEAFAKLDALDTKVTPAGRFTVARGFEKGYGPLFDIREIQGKDWAIAIHKVFLGFPWEHRATRLESLRYDDKNITFGCINVTPETMELLLRELPEGGVTPLYVLPRDEAKTAAFFAPPSS
jgi:hypothetical protein